MGGGQGLDIGGARLKILGGGGKVQILWGARFRIFGYLGGGTRFRYWGPRFRILGRGQGLEYWGGGGQGLDIGGGQGLEYWGARFRYWGGKV